MKSARSPGKKRRNRVSSKQSSGETYLRRGPDARHEQRFEAASSSGVIGSVVAVSLAAVAAGAGTYGQWLRPQDVGPHPWSTYLLGGAAVLMALVALFGQRPTPAARVGDGGVALEKDRANIERIAWFEVNHVNISDGLLTLTASGTAVSIPIDAHPDAARYALAEARARIPAAVAKDSKLPPVEPSRTGERIRLDPAQVAGEVCLSSGKRIAFEEDARLCGRCGAHYERASVPRQCLRCEARLR